MVSDKHFRSHRSNTHDAAYARSPETPMTKYSPSTMAYNPKKRPLVNEGTKGYANHAGKKSRVSQAGIASKLSSYIVSKGVDSLPQVSPGNNRPVATAPAPIHAPPLSCRKKSGFSFFQNSPTEYRDSKFNAQPQPKPLTSRQNSVTPTARVRDKMASPPDNAIGRSRHAPRPKKLLKLSLDINEINRDVQQGILSPVGETSRLEQRAIQIQCSSILDNFLYVGGVKVASNLETLLENKITHIINCVGHKCDNLWPDHFEYLTYKIPDNGTDDICPYLREAFEFIENAKRKHGKVLIHCVKGISRSPAIAMGYLMWKRQLTVEDALVIIRGHRQIADPNPSFVFQLKDWCERLQWQI